MPGLPVDTVQFFLLTALSGSVCAKYFGGLENFNNDLSAQACCVLTSPSNRQMARCRYCHSRGYVMRHQATRSKHRFGYCPRPNCCKNFYFKSLRFCARARRHPAPWQRPPRFSLKSLLIAVLFIAKLKRIKRRIYARRLALALNSA